MAGQCVKLQGAFYLDPLKAVQGRKDNHSIDLKAVFGGKIQEGRRRSACLADNLSVQVYSFKTLTQLCTASVPPCMLMYC